MARKDLKRIVNLIVEDECPKARDSERHKLKYRLEKLPEHEKRELEREYTIFIDKYRSKLRRTEI